MPENAPDKPEFIKISFYNGKPVALNGEQMKLAQLIITLNKIAGKHGVGIVSMFEDRLVGLKNGGVYELPAAHVIIEAHKALEKYVNTRMLNELKEIMDTKWGYLCYGAMWLDPVMQAMNVFNEKVNEKVTGEVTVKLFKGKADIVAMKSPYGLPQTSFSTSEGYAFNVNASAGFIEIYRLQMKLASQFEVT